MSNDNKIAEEFNKTNKFTIDLISNDDNNKIDEIYIMPMQFKTELAQAKLDMVNECLYNVILNVQNILNEQNHDLALNILLPGIADLYYRNKPEESIELIKKYNDNTKDEEPVLNQVFNTQIDQSSKMCFVFNAHIQGILDDIAELGFSEATNANKSFLRIMNDLLSELPYSYLDAALSFYVSHEPVDTE